jgi:hypothetical protein
MLNMKNLQAATQIANAKLGVDNIAKNVPAILTDDTVLPVAKAAAADLLASVTALNTALNTQPAQN